MERVQSSAFIFHRKLHKLPQLITPLIIIMCLNAVKSHHECNNGIRSKELYSDLTSGTVGVVQQGNSTRWLVSAAPSYNASTRYYLQQITVEGHYFVLYDPNARKFICWNNKYSKLVARDVVSHLPHCRFAEKVSLIREKAYTRFTTDYELDGRQYEAELKFSRKGQYASSKLIKNCVRKKINRINAIMERQNKTVEQKQKQKQLTDFMAQLALNRNAIVTLHSPEETKAYNNIQKYCADSDFFVMNAYQSLESDQTICEENKRIFCANIDPLRKSHNMAPKLKEVCHTIWQNMKKTV